MRAPSHGWVSASSLNLAAKCAASQVIPRILSSGGGKGAVGSALHEHLFHRVHFGIDGAMARLPALATKWELEEKDAGIMMARARSFSWTPPRGALPEISLCLYDDGEVRPVEGGKGVYDAGEGALVPAQLDCFWSEPQPLYRTLDGSVRCPPGSTLWCPDFKTGSDVYTEPVERNLQTLAAAVLAAKWTGADAAVPAIIYVRRGTGEWDVPEHALEQEDLIEAERLLKGVVQRVRRQRELYAKGEPLTYVTGSHCTFCPGRSFCPAQLAAVRGILNEGISGYEPGQLTDAQALRLAQLQPSVEALAGAMKSVLVAHTEARGPIELEDGRLWGPHPHEKDVLDPNKARVALFEEGLTEDEIGIAVKTSVSKQGIDDAVRAAHGRQGISRQKSKAIGRILGRLREAGGIVRKAETWFGLHRPEAPTLPATPALPANVPIDGDQA